MRVTSEQKMVCSSQHSDVSNWASESLEVVLMGTFDFSFDAAKKQRMMQVMELHDISK